MPRFNFYTRLMFKCTMKFVETANNNLAGRIFDNFFYTFSTRVYFLPPPPYPRGQSAHCPATNYFRRGGRGEGLDWKTKLFKIVF